MRNLLKLSVSLLVVFSMLFSLTLAALNVSAVENDVLGITVETVDAEQGENVFVKVDITNNPGIIALKLNLSYDPAALTLVGAVDGELIGDALFTNAYANPFTMTWNEGDAEVNNTSTGTLVTLEFQVKEDAAAGATVVTVETGIANDCINYDLNPVDVDVIPGAVNVAEPEAEVILGDTDGNGVIDSDDAVLLMYNVTIGAEEYPINQEADFDGNGVVDFNDAVRLLYNTLFGDELYPLL